MPRAVHTATLDVSSLAPSSTMMSCTVHSPTNSLAQPSCIVVYILCNPVPRGSPFELSLGLHSSQSSPIPPSPLRVSCVVVCPWFFTLGCLSMCAAVGGGGGGGGDGWLSSLSLSCMLQWEEVV